MKKKIANFAVFAILSGLFLFLPAIPKAQAASIDTNRLLEAMNGEQATATIKEIVKVGTELKQGNTSALKNIIFKKALEEVGISGENNNLIIENIKDIGTGISSAENKGAITKAVGNAVKERLRVRLSERLTPYQDTILILATLLDQDKLIPQAVRQNEELTGSPQNYKKIINMTATAYAPGPLDNGKWNDKTYTGGQVKKGVAAVDPDVIPMGTKLWVEGYGQAIADDQGSAIKGSRIDLAFDQRDEALAYGIKPVKVYILE